MDTDADVAGATLAGVKYVLKYAWVVILAVLGGVASYMQSIEQRGVPFSVFRLVTEIMVSGFVGVLVFLLCSDFGVPPLLTATLVGIGGHMGSRALNFLEAVFLEWLKRHNFME